MLGIDFTSIPMHPLVVHFPVVLAVLLPISALIALWAIRKGTTPRRAWALPLAMAAALAVSSWVATETGEQEEDRVEKVVAQRGAIHEHEEAAERLLVLSGALVLVAAAGLLPRTMGQAARILTTAGAIGLVAAAVQVGHSGGELVYRYGAASAYTDTAAGGTTNTAATAPRDAEGDDR